MTKSNVPKSTGIPNFFINKYDFSESLRELMKKANPFILKEINEKVNESGNTENEERRKFLTGILRSLLGLLADSIDRT